MRPTTTPQQWQQQCKDPTPDHSSRAVTGLRITSAAPCLDTCRLSEQRWRAWTLTRYSDWIFLSDKYWKSLTFSSAVRFGNLWSFLLSLHSHLAAYIGQKSKVQWLSRRARSYHLILSTPPHPNHVSYAIWSFPSESERSATCNTSPGSRLGLGDGILV